MRARHAAAGFAADLHPSALERVSAALEAARDAAREHVQTQRVLAVVTGQARAMRCADTQRQHSDKTDRMRAVPETSCWHRGVSSVFIEKNVIA